MTKRPPLFSLATHEYPWVSPPELADYLKCDRRSILRMIELGAIKGAYRVGRCWRIPTAIARATFPVERTSRIAS